MGNYFSNLHIKKGVISPSDIKAKILECMSEKGYVEADSGSADVEVALYAPADSAWTSVCCETFEYTDVLSLAARIAEGKDVDVLGVACFDSDYLFLNLLNTARKKDLWLNVGNSSEIPKPRRSNVAAWKDSVEDFKSFRDATKQSFVCAEDFLSAVQSNLNCPRHKVCVWIFRSLPKNCISLRQRRNRVIQLSSPSDILVCVRANLGRGQPASLPITARRLVEFVSFSSAIILKMTRSLSTTRNLPIATPVAKVSVSRLYLKSVGFPTVLGHIGGRIRSSRFLRRSQPILRLASEPKRKVSAVSVYGIRRTATSASFWIYACLLRRCPIPKRVAATGKCGRTIVPSAITLRKKTHQQGGRHDSMACR